MQKPFDALLAGLDKSLEELNPELPPIDRTMEAISLAREKILEIQTLAKKWTSANETEVAYFRDVWPAFFSRLGLYIKIYHLEMSRLTIPEEGWMDLIRKEENKVASFFEVHGDFWLYYRAKSPVLDEQFTRSYSRALVFDPLSLVIDPEGATLASYRAGECVAMEAYKGVLLREKNRLLRPAAAEDAEEYSWGGRDVDFVEWLSGLQAVAAVKYKGHPADLSRLEKWAAWALNIRVANIYDRQKVIRERKRERLKFTKRTEEALEKKYDAQDKRGG